MTKAEFDRDNPSVVEVIAAAFEEWLSAQGRAPALSMNGADLESLATLITHKLLDAGFIDEEPKSPQRSTEAWHLDGE